MTDDKIQFNLEITERINDFLDRTANENDTDKGEVIRFALDFLEAAVRARKDGLTIGAWKKAENGAVIQERILIDP